jgi:hypothetical protein
MSPLLADSGIGHDVGSCIEHPSRLKFRFRFRFQVPVPLAEPELELELGLVVR